MVRRYPRDDAGEGEEHRCVGVHSSATVGLGEGATGGQVARAGGCLVPRMFRVVERVDRDVEVLNEIDGTQLVGLYQFGRQVPKEIWRFGTLEIVATGGVYYLLVVVLTNH